MVAVSLVPLLSPNALARAAAVPQFFTAGSSSRSREPSLVAEIHTERYQNVIEWTHSA
jgi:hypothetical protein